MTGPVRSILGLGWPLLVGQLAVVANGVIDTAMAGRLSAHDLAGVAIGASLWFVAFVGLMGTVQALSPLVAQQVGAGRDAEVAATWRQGQWLVLMLAVPGTLLLATPGPWLALVGAEPAVTEVAAGYLRALAIGLPAALWLRAFTSLSTALGRPRAVMAINLIGPLLKVPLNTLFMHGSELPTAIGLPALPALGGAGCGAATAVVYAVSAAAAALLLARGPAYRRWSLGGPGRPDRTRIVQLLRLGLPIGATYLIDVTAFNMVTLAVARLGTDVVAAHAIATNVVVAAYMVPLAMSQAAAVLVGQALGGADRTGARRLAWLGTRLMLGLALAVAAVMLLARDPLIAAYTAEPAVVAIAATLLPWVALYHVVDAVQCALAFALRAYRVTLGPMVVFAVALWGIGLGGGAALAFGLGWGAVGFWVAATVALVIAGAGLALLFERTARAAPAASG